MPPQVQKVFVFTHDLLGDPFWDEFRRGLNDAEKQFPIRVLHHRVDRYAPGAMASLITRTLAAGDPDAILATIPVPEEVDAPLRSAIARGVPVFALNARDPRPAAHRIPYLLFIGAQDEVGGRVAARTLLDRSGCRCILLVDHYHWKQTCHSQRVTGARAELQSRGVRYETLDVDGADLALASAQVLAMLKHRPEIDGVMTLGPPGAGAVLRAVTASRWRLSSHVTFDLSTEQTQAICDGRILASIDCQQYLQGFLGVALASTYLRTGLFPSADIITGPRVVDLETLSAKRAEPLSSQWSPSRLEARRSMSAVEETRQ